MRPSSLEVATGWMTGTVDADVDVAWDGSSSPRFALESILLPALHRPRCVVDFSGGRDSSLVLAVATHVARREQLPLPVPYTRRFIAAPASEEAEWQETVVRHLRLPEWEVVKLEDQLDIIGEPAQAFMRAYGLLVPSQLYVLADSLGVARGGSRLTGEGGDEVLGKRRASFARWALDSPGRLRRPHSRSAIVHNVSPRPLRFFILWRDYATNASCAPWLREAPRRRFAFDLAFCEASEPFGWRASLRWHLRRRHIVAHRHNATAIASDYDVLHLDPLLDKRFVASLARVGGTYGFRTRTDAMTFLAEDLLPKEVLARKTKAIFNDAYFTETARTFARNWDGTGVDDTLVDAERLKAAWLSPLPPGPSYCLLQQAWLATNQVPTVPKVPSAAGLGPQSS